MKGARLRQGKRGRFALTPRPACATRICQPGGIWRKDKNRRAARESVAQVSLASPTEAWYKVFVNMRELLLDENS